MHTIFKLCFFLSLPRDFDQTLHRPNVLYDDLGDTEPIGEPQNLLRPRQ